MINLRKEFNKILDFDNEYNYVVVRHNTSTKCNCWRRESNTADPTCNNCEGGGWIFDEWVVKCKTFFATTMKPVSHLHDFDYGKTYSQNFTVYMKATDQNRTLKEGDLLFHLECTTDGKIINPVIRKRKWLIVDCYDIQADNNKTDFVKIHAQPLTV